MATETEKKFRIEKGAIPREMLEKALNKRIVQGYFNFGDKAITRLRLSRTLSGSKAFITIKGEKKDGSCLEFEYEIPVKDGLAMLPFCEGHLIVKNRYDYHYAGHLFEIDVFDKENSGLIIVEVELADIGEKVDLPDFLRGAEEVTHDVRFINVNLAQMPWSLWR